MRRAVNRTETVDVTPLQKRNDVNTGLKDLTDALQHLPSAKISRDVLERIWTTLSSRNTAPPFAPHETDVHEEHGPSPQAQAESIVRVQKKYGSLALLHCSPRTLGRVQTFPEELGVLATLLSNVLGENDVSRALWARALGQQNDTAATTELDPDMYTREAARKKMERAETNSSKSISVHYMIRSHMDQVLAIEQATSAHPWDKKRVRAFRRRKSAVPAVAIEEKSVKAFVFYEVHAHHYRIVKFGAFPELMQTAGRKLLEEQFIAPTRGYGIPRTTYRVPPECSEQEALLLSLGFRVIPEWRDANNEHRGTLFAYEPQWKMEHSLLKRAFGSTLTSMTDPESEGRLQVEAMVTALLNAQSAAVRARLVRNFASWLRTPEKLLAGAMLRKGWQHLRNVREPSDREFREYAASELTTYPPTPHSARKRDAPKPHAADLPFLEHTINCRKHRTELRHLRTLNSLDAVAAKEKAIAFEIFSAMMKFPNASQKRDSNPPSYHAGMPPYVVRNREITCFSGPWLMATMLLRAGIEARQLFLCKAFSFVPPMSYAGAHCSLLLSTSLEELFFLDSGFRRAGETFRLGECDEERMSTQLEALLKGTRKHPVSVRVKRAVAKTFNIPRRMQVLPLAEGIAGSHLYHVGLRFYYEEKYEEAEEALSLGLCFNRNEADALYHLGLLAFERGDTAAAEQQFQMTLRIDQTHLMAHFSLGELALDRGDCNEARRRFTIVHNDPREIWGDWEDTIACYIAKMAHITDDEMLIDWQNRQLTK